MESTIPNANYENIPNNVVVIKCFFLGRSTSMTHIVVR